MKKYLFIILIVLIISLFIKIPEYKELNNLKIIEGIGLVCINNNKILYLKELSMFNDSISNSALVIPHAGQGILNIFLNKQGT